MDSFTNSGQRFGSVSRESEEEQAVGATSPTKGARLPESLFPFS